MEYKEKIEDIKKIAAKYKSKGLTVSFHEESWQVDCNGAQDSGHLSMPLKTIENKTSIVAKGALRPYLMTEGKFKGAMMAGTI